MDVKPPVRLKESYSRMEDVRRQAELAPCGNFSAVYRCMCDYHGIEFMEDVAWVSFDLAWVSYDFVNQTCVYGLNYSAMPGPFTYEF